MDNDTDEISTRNDSNKKPKLSECLDSWTSPAFQIVENERRQEELYHICQVLLSKVDKIALQASRNALLMKYIAEKVEEIDDKVNKMIKKKKDSKGCNDVNDENKEKESNMVKSTNCNDDDDNSCTSINY